MLRAGETVPQRRCAPPDRRHQGPDRHHDVRRAGRELTATGRAMSEGGIGDTVTVQNPGFLPHDLGVVTGAGTVRATGVLGFHANQHSRSVN